MKWILAFHIIFVVTWFAGLFYLPRLFVYHASCTDAISIARFKIMERKLYNFIQMPSAILATIFGLWLLFTNTHYYVQAGWMHIKLTLVVLLWIYHLHNLKILRDFKFDRNKYSQKFYRFYNEIPSLLLIVIVILVVVRPGL